MCLVPAYSLVRACMLVSKGVGWHQAPGWFHLKCITNCLEEKIWYLNCLCIVFVFFTGLASFKVIYYIDKYCFKRILIPCLYLDWYPMLLFESSLSCAFWNVLSDSVGDFEKCTTLFRYFSLLCYLELWSIWFRLWNYGCLAINR